MSAKASYPLALMVMVVGLGRAAGQAPPSGPEGPVVPGLLGGKEVGVMGPSVPPVLGPAPMPVGPALAPTEPAWQMPPDGASQPAPGTVAQTSGLSTWMRYTKPDCCGPLGSHGPIMSELFVRNGPSIPVGGGVLGAVLQTGWMFEGGGRTLIFNSDMTGAWALEIGVSHNYNHADPNRTISYVPPGGNETGPQDLHLRQLQRTSFNWALGRETYFYAMPSGLALRGGFHVGGQLGSIKADWREIQHSTDMLWAVTLASNLDAEYPWGCCTLVGGFRVEWNAIFESDIVQHQNNNNLQSVNLLVTGGFRY
jgi:hypothetical protein